MSIPERERHIIETRLAEYGLSRFAPAFVASARRCLRLSSRRADVAVGRSKVGGDPDLAPGAPWPSCEGRAMTFLAQLDLADVASRIESPLPTSGLVSFFFDRSTMSEDNGLVVQWADGGHCWFLIEHAALEAGELERARATAQLG